jgi:hypothetical protein
LFIFYLIFKIEIVKQYDSGSLLFFTHVPLHKKAKNFVALKVYSKLVEFRAVVSKGRTYGVAALKKNNLGALI